MAVDICPCPKKSLLVEQVTVEGETWWMCKHQGCELRISGARHYWRPEDHRTMDAAPPAGEGDDDEEENEDED